MHNQPDPGNGSGQQKRDQAPPSGDRHPGFDAWIDSFSHQNRGQPDQTPAPAEAPQAPSPASSGPQASDHKGSVNWGTLGAGLLFTTAATGALWFSQPKLFTGLHIPGLPEPGTELQDKRATLRPEEVLQKYHTFTDSMITGRGISGYDAIPNKALMVQFISTPEGLGIPLNAEQRLRIENLGADLTKPEAYRAAVIKKDPRTKGLVGVLTDAGLTTEVTIDAIVKTPAGAPGTFVQINFTDPKATVGGVAGIIENVQLAPSGAIESVTIAGSFIQTDGVAKVTVNASLLEHAWFAQVRQAAPATTVTMPAVSPSLKASDPVVPSSEYTERMKAVNEKLGIPASTYEKYPLVQPPKAEDLVDLGELLAKDKNRIPEFLLVKKAAKGIKLQREAAEAFAKLASRASRAGIVLLPISGYRSPEAQEAIIRDKLASGRSITEIMTANTPPGHSEHHSGLAIDVGDGSESTYLSPNFDKTRSFTFLQENAGKHGFSLSYPNASNNGIQYEPWHWKYIGK